MWKDQDILQYVPSQMCQYNWTGANGYAMQGHNHDYRQEIKTKKIMLIHTSKITGSQH